MFALSVLAALGHLSQRERQGTGVRIPTPSLRTGLGMTGKEQCAAGREVRGGERCFEQVLRCFFVRCAKFGGETQNGVDIGVGECHN